ncbi:MAG: SRPBCC domain-containing protein [Chitinophagales bacterium]
MELTKITVEAMVKADKNKTWACYTQPEHITKWNFADPSWHCPDATNDMKVGGVYHARMEARDGSFGFNFDAVYTAIAEGKSFTYEFGGRTASVSFDEHNGETKVTIVFDPETQNPPERQQQGWQAILNNFKQYTESN